MTGFSPAFALAIPVYSTMALPASCLHVQLGRDVDYLSSHGVHRCPESDIARGNNDKDWRY